MALPAYAMLSEKDYLNLELHSDEKHEFFDGYIIGMAGSSYAHVQIQANLSRSLGRAFDKGKNPCEIFSSDLRVKAHDLKHFNPNLTILGGKPVLDEKSKSLTNPDCVIEILSPPTHSFDTDEKSFAYQHIQSIKEICFVDSVSRRIFTYARKDTTTFEYKLFTNDTCVIYGSEIVIDEIYRNSGV